MEVMVGGRMNGWVDGRNRSVKWGKMRKSEMYKVSSTPINFIS